MYVCGSVKSVHIANKNGKKKFLGGYFVIFFVLHVYVSSHEMHLALPASCMSQGKIIKVSSKVHASTFSTTIYWWVSLNLLNIFSKMECNHFWLEKKNLITLSCHQSSLSWEEYFCYLSHSECWLYNDSHSMHYIYLVLHLYDWNNGTCLPCPLCPYILTLMKSCLYVLFSQALIVCHRHQYPLLCLKVTIKLTGSKLMWKGTKVKWSHF